MIKLETLEDIKFLEETHTIECKSGVGRDGSGRLPKDFWETYSAFANSYGGTVLLGVKETSNGFELLGILNPDAVRRDLFTSLNNRQKVSVNLLTEDHVTDYNISGKTIIQIEIPRASRSQKPVFLKGNPLSGNTYKRLHEADVALQDSEVKRLLSEQVDDTHDARVLNGFDFNDIDQETFASYRRVFLNRSPNHVWNTQTDLDFLTSLGGWRRDRDSGNTGLTVAGLVMFGKMRSILDEFPNYMLDYQERPEAKTEKRWIDRITLDGSWSGNLYDFYRKVFHKITSELKVPFTLSEGQRLDETGIHVALREALANSLVHADFTGRASILVVKRPDMFGFRNPGLMRIPVDVALRGGESDCRNRTIHQMFRFVGIGEQAGSGIPQIFQGWKEQHWNPPKLHEAIEPYDQTLLELRMIDLFPDDTILHLRNLFDGDFDRLDYTARVALALASSEGTVNHTRLCSLVSDHPVDLSKRLQSLVNNGFLVTSGSGRGMVYYLPDQDMPSPEDVFPTAARKSTAEVRDANFGSSSSNMGSSSSYKAKPGEIRETRRNHQGCLMTDQLSLPVIDSLSELTEELRTRLETIAFEPRNKGRLNKEKMENVIIEVCKKHFITLQVLASLLKRSPEALRNQYLTPMVRSKKLELAFPQTPTHERQAYKTGKLE